VAKSLFSEVKCYCANFTLFEVFLILQLLFFLFQEVY